MRSTAPVTLFTLTANLLAETTAYYRELPEEPAGKTYRAERETFQVGGKGINVSRVAHHLGLRTHAIYFPGGCTGARCAEWISQFAFPSTHFSLSEETRSGWVVRGFNGEPETTWLGKDRPMDVLAWGKAISFLESNLRGGDALAISGSIPGWREEIANPFLTLLRLLSPRNFLAVDTYGPALRELCALPLDLVKINRREFAQFLGCALDNQDIPDALRGLADQIHDRTHWVVTDGSERIHARTPDGRIVSRQPPEVQEISPVGCGDLFFAVLIVELLAGKSLEEALDLAIPMASASAATENLHIPHEDVTPPDPRL